MWPTAELHVHIEGTLEAPLIRTLAQRHGLPVPAGIDDRAPYPDLQSFLDVYYANLDVLRTERDFYDLTAAYLDRAALAGVRHAEVFVDPQSHTARGVPLADVLNGVLAALDDAQRIGISTGLIVCFLRHLGPEAAAETLEAVLPWRDRLLGVGLDSSEVGFPPSLFREVFARAAELGLHRVAHAGEEGGPDYVWEAVDVLGVERVDHGNRALEDAELVAVLRERQIPLTVCPLSNLALRTAGPDLADHPLSVMLDEGLLASVHSDDPAYFGGYLDDNIRALVAAGAVSEALRGRLAVNAIRSAFLDETRRAELLDAVSAHALAIGAPDPVRVDA
ncbi:adenosine deaminase [Cellulomonas sp. NPDC089187]|uniref:adenosine deaminase n=1 Tax=Cellulomonas sp. NPDC089187 TaxID=3154970 RepID=UPI00341E7891